MAVSIDMRVLELVCSRICHDLVSPVGAINNGIELIREVSEGETLGGGIGQEALALITHSAEQGSYRLRIMRLAYGAAGGDASWDELRSALDHYFAGTRIVLAWPSDANSKLPRDVHGLVKLTLNAVMLAGDALSQNGAIAIEARSNALAVIATGKSPAIDPDRAAALAGRTAPADLDPRSIHAYMTGRLAVHYGLKLSSVSVTPERLEVLIALS